MNYKFHTLGMASLNYNAKNQKQLNKYLSFNQSIHAVMGDINRMLPNSIKDIKNIHNLLLDNWISDGYVSKDEEEAFFIKGLIILKNYIYNHLDSGVDNILINKTLNWQIKRNNIICAKIDKVYEHESGSIEIVDYKTGRIINHKDNFKLDLRTSIYIVLVYENLKLLPNSISYYYLRPNKKFTHNITESDLHQSYNKIYDHYKFIRETLYLNPRHIPYA